MRVTVGAAAVSAATVAYPASMNAYFSLTDAPLAKASSRAESHRPALSEPCVNLSIHTAPTIQHYRSM